ncbi:MAG: acylphosphatase [Fimbriimonadaceae bacterium]|nr:acylphosphatase [Fimbriimonadaceae bacterium]
MSGFRAVVFGRVQGVGFRSYVRRLAELHGITGAVWNRTDGAVEIEACHEDPIALSALCDGLKSGPGRVDRVDRYPATVEADEFRIAATRSPI